MWRRIVEIPFVAVIPEHDRDPGVKARLCDPEDGGPAVLAWLVEGCLGWQREGLSIPLGVRHATDAYRTEVDSIGTFLQECAELLPQLTAPAGELYGSYRAHCERNGERPVSGRLFKGRLEARGFRQRKTKAGIVWKGLAMLHDDEAAS